MPRQYNGKDCLTGDDRSKDELPFPYKYSYVFVLGV